MNITGIMITVSFTNEEVAFLEESLKYAQMFFDDRVASYPEPVRTPYYERLKPEKDAMFQKIMEKLNSAKPPSE